MMSSLPLPPLTHLPADVASLSDYEPLAQERMSDAAWAFVQGGSGDEQTLRANIEAFSRLCILPRVLTDFRAGGETSLTLFGQPHTVPILIAPVAFQQLMHPEVERATLLAAAGAAGVAHALHLLRTELEMAMALSGCRTLVEIDRSRVKAK